MEKRLAVALLIGGLILGAALLLIRAGAVNTLSHDDGISYLAATGHMGAYATAIPAGRWVQAEAWQNYWQPDRFGIFAQIGSDLARYDIHPPLYFWLLHAWIQVTGVRLSAGPLLNTILLLLGAWLIVVACRTARGSWGASVAAALLWLLNGATLAVAGATRQYSLLGLAVASLTAALLFFLERRSFAAALLVYAAAVAGILTHYQFAVVLALGTLIAAILLARGRRWRVVALLLAAVTLAGLTFFLLHPGFMSAVVMQRGQAAPISWADLPYRATRILSALFEQALPAHMARAIGDAAVGYWGLSVLVALTAGLGLWLIVRGRLGKDAPGVTDGEIFLPTFTAAAFLMIATLYLLQISPRHAMGAPYLMAVSPLLFMTGAKILDRLAGGRRWQPALILALISYQAGYGGWATLVDVRTAAAEPSAIVSDADNALLLDSVARGVLPTVLWHVPGSTPVYAAMQDDLLGSFPEIPTDVQQLVYVSDLRYGNDVAKQTHVLARLAAQGFRSVVHRGGIDGAGEVFALTR